MAIIYLRKQIGIFLKLSLNGSIRNYLAAVLKVEAQLVKSEEWFAGNVDCFGQQGMVRRYRQFRYREANYFGA